MADQTFGERRWHLIQDGARCHTSVSTLDALFEASSVLPQWPPNSHHLSPTECFWGAIQRRIEWGEMSTREEAVQIIKWIWSEFDLSSRDSLVGPFENRKTILKDAEGRRFFSIILIFFNAYLVEYKPSKCYQNSTQYAKFQPSKPITARENRFSLLANKNFHFGGPCRLWVVTGSQDPTLGFRGQHDYASRLCVGNEDNDRLGRPRWPTLH
jgi:hypothetical protein